MNSLSFAQKKQKKNKTKKKTKTKQNKQTNKLFYLRLFSK